MRNTSSKLLGFTLDNTPGQILHTLQFQDRPNPPQTSLNLRSSWEQIRAFSAHSTRSWPRARRVEMATHGSLSTSHTSPTRGTFSAPHTTPRGGRSPHASGLCLVGIPSVSMKRDCDECCAPPAESETHGRHQGQCTFQSPRLPHAVVSGCTRAASPKP
jgi:hypothetical protein